MKTPTTTYEIERLSAYHSAFLDVFPDAEVPEAAWDVLTSGWLDLAAVTDYIDRFLKPDNPLRYRYRIAEVTVSRSVIRTIE